MKILSLSCDKCGAPLDVPAKVRRVTCTYCNSRLEVRRTGGTAYTSLLDSIDERTARIAEDVAALREEQELERVDREWQMERARHLVQGKRGEYIPTRSGSLVGGLLAAAFGVFWVGMTLSMGAPGFFPVFGVIFIAVAIFGAVRGASKASSFENARRRYQRRRRETLRSLRERSQKGE